MKRFALSMFGAFIGVGLALLLYDRFIVQPRETGRAQAAAIDLSRAAVEAQRITDSVDSSVKQSIDSAKEAFETQAADQNKRRMASEAIAQTQLYKVALTESFMANGKWPARASEAGLQQNNTRTGGAIRNISVGERGTVTVTFDNHFGEGALLELIPDANPDTYQVNWRCRTSGDADLKRYLPHCSGG
jgi:hypothetical protein